MLESADCTGTMEVATVTKCQLGPLLLLDRSRCLKHSLTHITMRHAIRPCSPDRLRLLPTRSSRVAMLLLLNLAIIGGWGASCYAQKRSPAPVVRPPSSNDSAAVEAARERVNTIIQNNAQAQEAIKEAGDRLKQELAPDSGGSGASGLASSPEEGGFSLIPVCHSPSGALDIGCKNQQPSAAGEPVDADGPQQPSAAGEPVIADAPYISDVKDKILPATPVDPAELLERQRGREASDLLRDSQQLLQNTDCAALMSTYRPGPTRALPSECMTPAEAMSVYTPIGRSQPTAAAAPEPVIDGSQIPSVIDFTLGPAPSQSSDRIAPIAIDRVFVGPPAPSPQPEKLPNTPSDLDSAPNTPSTTLSPTYDSTTPPLSPGAWSQGIQESDNPGSVGSSVSSGATQADEKPAESDSTGGGLFDRIFEAGKEARDGYNNFQIQVGDYLRGITRDADGAPVKKGSKQNTKKDSIQDQFDKKIDELLNQ